MGIDLQLRKDLLELFHGSAVGGHFEAHQTMDRICAAVYWKELKRDVRQYVRECHIFQQCKYEPTTTAGLFQLYQFLTNYGPIFLWTSLKVFLGLQVKM